MNGATRISVMRLALGWALALCGSAAHAVVHQCAATNALNSAHISANRAVAGIGGAYAKGSGEYLGTTGQSSTVSETVKGYFEEGTCPAADACYIETAYGPFRGEQDGDACRYAGVPYAEPPTGSLRWKTAQAPVSTWNGDGFVATDFKSGCVQPLDPTDTQSQTLTGSEDCLHLAIWTPTELPQTPNLPVLFYIHGGANWTGTSSWPTINGANLAAKGAVVVSIDYRLGVFGWLADPVFKSENVANSTGNYAISDMIMALHIVNLIVGDFGGDTDKILLFGQSAGAINTCYLLATPYSVVNNEPLFNRALMQSGTCSVLTEADSEEFADHVAAEVSCTGGSRASCLRSKTPAEIALVHREHQAGRANMFYNAVVDGTILPATPLSRLAAGEHFDVPLIVGATSHEYFREMKTIYDHDNEWLDDDTDYSNLVHAFIDDTEAAVLLGLYPSASYSPPPSGFSSQAIAAGALFGDVWQQCAGREIRSAVVNSTAQAPVWSYLFTYAPTNDVDGAGHGEDVRYVFQTGSMNQTEAALSDRMSDAWIRFADTGDPNEVSEWPQFTTQDETARVFDGDVNQVTYDGYRSTQCDAMTNAGIGSEYFFPQATN